MTISGCMIVRDEEENLSRAIECLTSFVDEIIIVDTGSVDRTKEIAFRYTDKVYNFKWCNDFSAARNFAFSKATMNYIYIADADEVIDQLNQKKIINLKKTLPPDIEIVQMKYSNQFQFGTIYNFDMEYRPKLFKRLRSFHWIDPIHETIDTKIRMLDSEIVIIHAPGMAHASRDLSIFGRIAKAGSLISPRLHRLYAQELFVAGEAADFLNAYEYFEWSLHQEECTPDEIRQSQCVVARCCNLRADSVGLFKVSLKNVIGQPCAEICCDLGDYFFNTMDFEEAAIWYYTAAFGAESELNIHSSGDLPLHKISDCYIKLGNTEEAEKYDNLANEWAPRQQ